MEKEKEEKKESGLIMWMRENPFYTMTIALAVIDLIGTVILKYGGNKRESD